MPWMTSHATVDHLLATSASACTAHLSNKSEWFYYVLACFWHHFQDDTTWKQKGSSVFRVLLQISHNRRHFSLKWPVLLLQPWSQENQEKSPSMCRSQCFACSQVWKPISTAMPAWFCSFWTAWFKVMVRALEDPDHANNYFILHNTAEL